MTTLAGAFLSALIIICGLWYKDIKDLEKKIKSVKAERDSWKKSFDHLYQNSSEYLKEIQELERKLKESDARLEKIAKYADGLIDEIKESEVSNV